MSLKIQGGIVHIGTYNDNSREYHIKAEEGNVAETIQQLETEDKPVPGDRYEEAEAIDSEPILSIPGERKYSEVRTYIKERCRFDAEFKEYVESHSRVELCQRLSNEFGWFVDDHKLGVNMNRHRN